MKPIIRWTIGFDHKNSYEILRYSVNSFFSIYQNKFDYYICYNNCNPTNLSFKTNVTFIDQKEYINSLIIKPYMTSWKLYPPRLNNNVHEIFIDNDLILFKKHEIIDEFIAQKNMTFATEAFTRRYGIYDNLLPENILINTGLVGVPPNFNLNKYLNNIIKNNWKGWYDEQGIFSYILYNNKNFKTISLKDISVCHGKYKLGKYGIHFVGINSNHPNNWYKFLCNRLI